MTFILFTPTGDTVTELSALDTPISPSGRRNGRRQRTSAIRLEVVIAVRKGNEFEFTKYYVFKRVRDDYSPKDGPPFADPTFADIRWVMPLSSDDHVTWEAGRASIKKNDTFPFQDEMVIRLAPDNPYLSANYRRDAALGPAQADEPRPALSDLMQQARARKAEAANKSQSIAAAKSGTGPANSSSASDAKDVASKTAQPLAAVTTPPLPPKPATAINPILTTDALFTIPGTTPIGKGLIDDATQNVEKAAKWINPLIRGGERGLGRTDELSAQRSRQWRYKDSLRRQPKADLCNPGAATLMSKSTTNLSIGIPAEHYQEAGMIFEDLLELFVWNLPPGQDRASHERSCNGSGNRPASFTTRAILCRRRRWRNSA